MTSLARGDGDGLNSFSFSSSAHLHLHLHLHPHQYLCPQTCVAERILDTMVFTVTPNACDPSTLSNPQMVMVTSMDIKLNVDFESSIIKGVVSHQAEVRYTAILLPSNSSSLSMSSISIPSPSPSHPHLHPISIFISIAHHFMGVFAP